MIGLYHIFLLSVFSLLRCYSAWAQDQEQQPFATSIVPSEVEGQTLEVPRGQLRKIAFTVTYIPSGIDYIPGLQIDGRRFNIGNNNIETRRLLSIVRRSCEDSNNPGESCKLLQVTVNGTNEQISELEGRTLEFIVMRAETLFPVRVSGPIILRIVDPPTTDEPMTTKPETTTEEPMATTESTTGIDILDPNQIARMDRCEPIRVETILPWVFVAILAVLLFVTIGILILVICKHKKSQDGSNKQDTERGFPLPDRTDSNNPASTTPKNCDSTSQSSSSKDSLSELK